MDYNKIRALLEKYWEADTSLEEEALLRRFFVTHREALPEDLREAAPLFGYFQAESEKELPALPEASILPLRRARPWQHWMKYAAMLLLLAGVGYSIQQFRHKQQQLDLYAWQQDTFTDPEKAYRETEKALELLARNLHKGTTQMEKLSYFNEATEKVRGEE